MLKKLFNLLNVNKAISLISKSKKIFIFTGAGISASAGIPTFRDVGGLWTIEEIESFGSPETWLEKPDECWNAYERFRCLIQQKSPTASHVAIKKLSEIKDVTVATTNVDSLHRKTGTYAYEIHGSLRNIKCSNCEDIKRLDNDIVTQHISCEKCGVKMRHDVVLWDESVRYTEEVENAINDADCIIFIGMSGTVTDIEEISKKARETGKSIIEINPAEETPATKYSNVSLKVNSDQAFPKIVEKIILTK